MQHTLQAGRGNVICLLRYILQTGRKGSTILASISSCYDVEGRFRGAGVAGGSKEPLLLCGRQTLAHINTAPHSRVW